MTPSLKMGFVTLNFTASKTITEKLVLGLVARNMLNPEIKRTQLVRNPNTQFETNETVLSYTRGAQIGLNLTYTF